VASAWLIASLAAGLALLGIGFLAGRWQAQDHAERARLDRAERRAAARHTIRATAILEAPARPRPPSSPPWPPALAADVAEVRALRPAPQLAARSFELEIPTQCAPDRCLSPTWCYAPRCYAPAAPAPAPAVNVPDVETERPPTSPEDLELYVRHLIEKSQLDTAQLIARTRHAESEER